MFNTAPSNICLLFFNKDRVGAGEPSQHETRDHQARPAIHVILNRTTRKRTSTLNAPMASAQMILPTPSAQNETRKQRSRPTEPSQEMKMPSKSKAQQQAAGAALAAKRGDKSKSQLRGASREMAKSMSEKELEKLASTRQKGKPEHKSKS